MQGWNGKLGFGCMRLPMKGEEVDTAQVCQMVDLFLESGFNYFDTAHGYIGGKSETALRECLTSRYPRERYILTNKLSPSCFETNEQIRPLFESQLAACGVDYFDAYLMHAQSSKTFAKFKQCRAYETALELKAEGRFRFFGLSFHDKAEVLDQILTEYPQIELVQLQFNYLDYDDPSVQSRACYEVCQKHHKKILVMEPVKGGSLANLPPQAKAVLDTVGGQSPASYAIRYAAGFEEIVMVLSGMSDLAQMRDNTSFMREFAPLSEAEHEAVRQVASLVRAQDAVPCTACRYCVDGCPRRIPIPELFACLNAKKVAHSWTADQDYHTRTAQGGKASSCIQCGQCEAACPQHLPIRELLAKTAKVFE